MTRCSNATTILCLMRLCGVTRSCVRRPNGLINFSFAGATNEIESSRVPGKVCNKDVCAVRAGGVGGGEGQKDWLDTRGWGGGGGGGREKESLPGRI